jgi:hypothetical protein
VLFRFKFSRTDYKLILNLSRSLDALFSSNAKIFLSDFLLKRRTVAEMFRLVSE